MPAPGVRVPAAERGRLLQRLLRERPGRRDGQRLQVRPSGVLAMTNRKDEDKDKERPESPGVPGGEEKEPIPVPPDQPSPTAPVEDPRPEPPPAGDPPAGEPTRLV